jgi:hypothetical protein
MRARRVNGQHRALDGLRGDTGEARIALTDHPDIRPTIVRRKVPAGDDPRVPRLAMGLEPERIAGIHAHVHREIVAFRRAHGEQVGLDLGHVLDGLHRVEDAARQEIGARHHVHVPHRPTGAELEGIVHRAFEEVGLPLDRFADLLHDEQQEERRGDEQRDDSEANLAASEIPEAESSHTHQVLRIASGAPHRVDRAQADAADDRVEAPQPGEGGRSEENREEDTAVERDR